MCVFLENIDTALDLGCTKRDLNSYNIGCLELFLSTVIKCVTDIGSTEVDEVSFSFVIGVLVGDKSEQCLTS